MSQSPRDGCVAQHSLGAFGQTVSSELGVDGPTAEPLPLAAAQQSGDDTELQSRSFASRLGAPFLESLGGRAPSAEFIERVPIGFARQHLLLGLASDEPSLPVVLGDVAGWRLLDVLSRYLKRTVTGCFAPRTQVIAAINAAYQQRTGQAQHMIELLDEQDVLAEIQRLPAREDLLDVADRAPVIRLVNLILFEAVTGQASDVHIQPYEDRLVVRLRIDGVLFDAFTIPKPLQDEVIGRIKVSGRMNIAEKRLPQDGRATVQVGDRLIDLRIASMPTSHGERVVIRLLDKSARLYSLTELGMDLATLERFRELIHLEHGLILVTGPTGSGKSTTLYAALQVLNTKDRNAVTLEDPIEYQLEGISQTQVNTKKGMTFASGLRSVLRQDPDIIMVGEIRDHETAVMAIQSALTGHLVFSTLHTNDAASAITRMLDLGIEPYLVASSVIAVLAQRLVRRNCPQCVAPCRPTARELAQLGIAPEAVAAGTIQKGAGCKECRQTGYRGRIGLFELLVIDDAIRSQVQTRAHASDIRDAAVRSGMKLLRDDGIARILSGLTTPDEVIRVAMRTTL
jgi:general secretion pathway protein E